MTNTKKPSLRGYAQQYRSGITMREKWATDKRIAEDRREMAQPPKYKMGKNE